MCGTILYSTSRRSSTSRIRRLDKSPIPSEHLGWCSFHYTTHFRKSGDDLYVDKQQIRSCRKKPHSLVSQGGFFHSADRVFRGTLHWAGRYPQGHRSNCSHLSRLSPAHAPEWEGENRGNGDPRRNGQGGEDGRRQSCFRAKRFNRSQTVEIRTRQQGEQGCRSTGIRGAVGPSTSNSGQFSFESLPSSRAASLLLARWRQS